MSKKYVVITGATGNLGSKVTEAFVEAGYYVVGTAEKGKSKESTTSTEFYEVDLKDSSQVEEFFNTLKSETQRLHAVICLAGGFGMNNILNGSNKDVQAQFELNFITAFNTVKYGYEWMKNEGGGRIVLVGAKPALEGNAFEVMPYALSKGALIHLAQILNEKSNEHQVITSVIAPSIIDTPPNREAMSDANFDDWVKPEDIAGNILHLVSTEAKIIRNPLVKLYGNS